jgi:2-polyprenyl-3-methyl-5-hydroxy-6-metoxy-1,4-benzoquinol methylase
MSADLKYTKLVDDPDESHAGVLDLIPPGSAVLEIGAATGYMSKAIQARGCAVVAVEKDPEAASLARAAGIDVRTGRLEEVGLSDTFDCLVLADVLEHVPDPDEFFEKALRHLRPGGWVVLSVPNVAHWSLRWSLLRGRFDYTRTGLLDDTHLRFYTARTLESLLARHRLTIVERRASGGFGCYPRWKSHEVLWRQRQLIRWLKRTFPRLFAYQFVWKARLEKGPAEASDRSLLHAPVVAG